MRVLDTCLRVLGGAVVLFAVAVSSVVVGSVQAARVNSAGGGAGTLDQAFDGGKTIDGANSEANALVLGDGTRSTKEWCDATYGCVKKPSPLADSLWRVWTNMNAYIWDEESNSAFATIDPDALGTGSGTMTFATGHQVVASNLGIELTESDTNPTCGAGNFTIYADLSENKLKKCQNGTPTDLDTVGSSVTEGVVRKAADETVNNSSTPQNDDELLIPLDANSTYIFDGIISYNSSTTADLQLDFTVPSGAVGRRVLNFITSSSTNCLSTSQQFYGGLITTSATAIGGTGGGCDIVIRGTVTTSSTSGNFQVLWAQNVAEVSDTKVLLGSFLRWRKL